MKNILILVKASIRRNKISLFISAACAVVIILFINSFSNDTYNTDRIHVGFIDYDKTVLSEDLKGYLTDDLEFDLVEDTYENLSSQLILREISVIIEVPKGFCSSAAEGNPMNISLTAMNDFENKVFTSAYLESYMGGVNTMSNCAAGDEDEFINILNKKKDMSVDIVVDESYGVDNIEEIQQNAFENFLGMFLFLALAACMFISLTVFDDRMSGTYNRIKLSPIRSIQYIIGITLFGILQLMLMVVVVCAYIKITGLFIGMSLGLLFLLMTLISIFLVGFSLVVALLCNSKMAIMTIIVGFSTISCMLGGAFFPIEKASDTLQNVAKITPHYWFMSVIRNYQAAEKINVANNIIVLILFTVLIYLIGAVLFTQKKMYRN